MRCVPVLLVALAACGPEYMSSAEFMYDFPDPPLRCAADDPGCPEVSRRLEVIRGTIGDGCGTERLTQMIALRRMGDRAVPTLLQALNGRDGARPYFAADLLESMGHQAEVAVWCRAHAESPNFPYLCQGLNPFTLLVRAGAL
jgi:hypothetical protein